MIFSSLPTLSPLPASSVLVALVALSACSSPGEVSIGDKDADTEPTDAVDTEIADTAMTDTEVTDSEPVDTDIQDTDDTDLVVDTNPLSCMDIDIGSSVPLVYTDDTTGMGADYGSAFCPSAGSDDLQLGFTAPEDGRYRFDLDADFDSVLALRQGCGDELSCADAVGTGEKLEIILVAGEFVIVVVDGWDAQGPEDGAFELSVIVVPDNETSCIDGIDEDADGVTDCQDSDCYTDPNCLEICDNGEDDNGSGDVDCADPVCETDPACLPQCPNITAAGTLPETISGSTVGALDEHDPGCADSFASDIAVSYTAPSDGDYVIFVDTDYDPVLSIHDGCYGAQLKCNDDWSGYDSQLTISLTAGQNIVINVDGYDNSDGEFDLYIYELEEVEQDCTDGFDLDHDDDIDCEDDDCALDPSCVEICDDLIDNNNNGYVDCADSGCVFAPHCAPQCPEFELPAPPSTIEFSTLGRPNLFDPTCANHSDTSDVSVAFSVPADGTYTFDTIGSDYDTVLSALTGCLGAVIDCNDDINPGVDRQSTLTLTLTKGQVAILVVDGWEDESGNVVLNVSQ